MISEKEILDVLDRSKDGTYSTFIWLGDVYSHLIDCRLNVFSNGGNKWAIAAERLGYNPRASQILLEISYYGNCLANLEECNNEKTNYCHIAPIDIESFLQASNDSEGIKDNAESILVRGKEIKISHNKEEYQKAGITLHEVSNEIRWEEAARLFVSHNRNLFRATDNELYKSIPGELKKILVIDEWFHKDFEKLPQPPIISDEHLRYTYEFNKKLTGAGGADFETFAASFREQERKNSNWNEEQWNDNRPGSYETWQMIAKVISTGTPAHYKPTLKANTNWMNWPQSGSL